MADVYKTAFALTLEGRLESQLLSAVKALRGFDGEVARAQAHLNKLTLPTKLAGDLTKLRGVFGTIATSAIESNQKIIASYSAMGGKLGAELRGLKGISADVGRTLNREMKGAFSGVTAEVTALKRQLSELQAQARAAAAGGRSIRHGGGGGGILDTIAMGPSHSGYYAGRNIQGFGLGFVQDNASLQRQANIYRMTGRSEADVRAGVSAAYGSSMLVPDVGVVEQMKLLRELDSATQDAAGSRNILPMIARSKSVIAAATGRDSEEDMRRIFKFIELRGGAIDEHAHRIIPEKFGAELNAATKALVAGGGLLTTNDIQQFGRQAGIMAKGMSPDDLYVSALAAMEDMGGGRAGTSLTAVGRQFIAGTMTSKVAGVLNEYGLLTGKGQEVSDQGNIKITDPKQAIKGYGNLEGGTFLDFVEKVIRPAMVAKGVTDRADQNREAMRLFGTDTARRLGSLYLTSPEQIDAVGKRYKMSMGTDAYDKVLGGGKDFNTSSKALSESIHTLKTALGDSETLAKPLFSLAQGISAIANVVRGQDGASTMATLGMTGTGAAALAYGSFKTATGFGLPAAAAELTVAAKMLQGAAGMQGGGPGGAGKGGWLGKVAGVLGIGALAAGAESVGALQPPSMQDGFWKSVTKFLDPGLAARVFGEEIKKPAEEAGKAAGEATTKGFKGEDYQGAGSAAGSSLLRGFMDFFSKMGAAGIQPTSFGGGGGFGGLIQKASLGGGGLGGSSGPMPGIPSSVAMTAAERNTLGLIQKYESGGRNVMNYIGDRKHTAQGYFQITNTNWRRIAPKLGITAPNAMAATLEEQTRVAHHLLRNGGVQNWTNFNPRLRGAIGRGEQAPAGTPPTAGAPPKPPEKPIITQVHLDGRVIAKAVTTRMASDAKFPRKMGGMDTHGSYRPPGTTLTDAA